MADWNDPAAPETQTQAPDQQQTMGAPTGGAATGSLMDTLTSLRGSVPNEAIMALLQGPSYGQKMAQAAAGGSAIALGIPNPVTPILEQQQRQQMGVAAMLERMNENQRQADQWFLTEKRHVGTEARHAERDKQLAADAKATREHTALMNQVTIAREMLTNAPDAFRGTAAANYAKVAGQVLGREIPPEEIAAMAQPKFDLERRKEIVSAMAGIREQITDPILQQNAAERVAGQFGLTPASRDHFWSTSGSDLEMSVLGMSPGALANERVQWAKNKLDLIEASRPSEIRDPKYGHAVVAIVERVWPGTPFTDLTKAQLSRAWEMAKSEDAAQELAKFRQHNAITVAGQNAHSVFAAGLAAQAKGQRPTGDIKGVIYMNATGDVAARDLTADQALATGYSALSAKEAEAVNAGQRLMRMLVNIRESTDAMKEAHLFQEGGGVGGLFQAGMIGAKRVMGSDTDRGLIANFTAQKGDVIALMRTLGDTVRAMQAMTPITEALSPRTGYPGVIAVMANIELAIRAAAVKSRTPQMYDDFPKQIFVNRLTGPATRTIPGIGLPISEDGVKSFERVND